VNVHPLDLARLPRVGGAEATATRGVARAVGAFPWRVETRMPPFGVVSLVYAGIGRPASLPVQQVAFGVVKAGRSGRLLLDEAFAHTLIAGMLGDLAPPPSLRRLGVGERGVLGGLIAAVLDRLGIAVSLSLSGVGPTPAGLPLAIEATVGDHYGRVVLEVPPEWLREPSSTPRRPERAGRITVALSLEVAVTDLAAKEVASLAVGDAIVFDGTAALPAEFTSPWPIRVTVGGYAAPALLGGDAKLALQAGFDPIPSLGGESLGGKEIAMEGSGTSVDAVAVLAAAPVEVVAELGRITLRGDEVLGLAPGTVLAFPGSVTGAVPIVRLRVAGEIWAEGELVDVDGALGVRVTALKRG
jgi:type III secretion system YscQ/HrcQ family protein